MAESFLLGTIVLRRSFLLLHGGDTPGDRKRVAETSLDAWRQPAPLSRMTGFSLTLRESQVGSNARDAGRFGLSGDVRSVRTSLRIRFGRTLWTVLHGLSEGWPCRRCRPSMVAWMQGLHDAVNVRLGKRPFHPEALVRFSSGALNGSYHIGCFGCRIARWASRLVARTPRLSVDHQ